ncbi:MAG TPA: hypothetical protein VMQ93_18840 [Novosphingobium sp.]|nr:hypothetical protein [Novosphingobium sp.]
MPDSEPTKEARAEARADARSAEEAAVRRRWVTLGEVLAVAAVAISGLTLWNNWSERSATEATKTGEALKASKRAATLVLVTTSVDEERLTLKPASAEQSVQSQTIAFPTALDLAPVETTGEPRIEAAWFERGLKKARDAAKLPDDSRGDEQLPVLVTTRFLVDGQPHEDVALYDIGYSISGRWLAGHSVALRGVSLVSRVKETGARARLDARWNTLFAKPPGS